MNQTAPTTCRATLRRGFTLIELLVVIAVTAVLFALLIIPLVSALRYTQQAQLVAAAQDAARVTKERLTRELSAAAFVFDGTSHPFKVPAGNTTSPGDDRYTNFLDLQILSQTGTPVLAHAYTAKLDFVLPKLNSGDAVDPTTNEPITYHPTNGSAVIGNPSYIFPPAPGTTMIRYFVGLKDPTQPYNNTHEGKANRNADDNTYILYRAQFQPYITMTANGKTTVAPNPNLFATSTGSNIPELDDPDFFRYVNQNGATDTNWLDDMHAAYPTQTAVTSVTAATANGSAAQHNYRVENWIKIAKPVIPGPDIDLILLPHNSDNTLNYDTGTGACTASGCPGVAHSGIVRDPVTGTYYPIVNTSVTFRPATVSGDATPGTTSDYSSQGVTPTDQAGYTYVPTVYTANSQSWSQPYHVTLFPSNFSANSATAALRMYYETDDSPSDVTVDSTNNLMTTAGDVLEYSIDAQSGTQTAVYNVTQNFAYPVTGTNPKQYVPMSISPDTGTINFATPSLPNGPKDRYTRQWVYGLLNAGTPAGQRTGGIDPMTGLLDLTKPISSPAAITDSPLAGTDPTNSNAATGITNAHIAPGSVRVYGPDTRPGASNGSLVSYTEVNLNSTASSGQVGDNQFAIDYLHGTIQFSSDLTTLLSTNSTVGVSVIYDYQANLTLTDPTKPFSYAVAGTLDNTYQPMQVQVDYQTRDLIDVSIGVRIYDVSTNRAQVIPAETKIKIGNSNR